MAIVRRGQGVEIQPGDKRRCTAGGAEVVHDPSKAAVLFAFAVVARMYASSEDLWKAACTPSYRYLALFTCCSYSPLRRQPV